MSKKHLEPEKVMCLYQAEVQNVQIVSQFVSDYRIKQSDFLSSTTTSSSTYCMVI